MNLNTTGMAAVRPYRREMTTGQAMLYREGGRHYMVSNEKLQDGTLLFDHMHDWRG